MANETLGPFDESHGPTAPVVSPSVTPPPRDIGPYHILEPLGEGGMGEVYKAERRTPIRQTVAIKIIKLGFNSREVIARFESERQALARMDHPNIARVLDAGTTDTGRPYFVMEYVPGKPITDFADEHKLPIRERLLLFLQVCQAIAHAHTKALIHRDIKASNVLAFVHDGKPNVKIIDFGIAKALTGDRLTDLTFNTEHGRIIGTYESMSPEQADGSPDIDTRTDVYSLGVLLYELLTGVKPFDKATLANAAQQEIRRIIREVEPPRPSTRLTNLGGERATRIAAERQAKLEQLARELRSELEWIPLKAMRKERDRRYASPQQLALDIQNYLEGRPLLAGPEARTYRLRKFVGRNRLLVGAVATIVGLLIVGAAGTSIGLIRESRQRAYAEQQRAEAKRQEAHAVEQAAIAEAVNRFLTDMLSAADPGRLLGEKVTVVQAVTAASQELDRGALRDQPVVEAAVRGTIGTTLVSLAQYDAAEPNLRKALDLLRKSAPANDARTAAALENLATLAQFQNKLPEAETSFREALQIYRSALPAGHHDIGQCMGNLGLLLKIEAKYDEAEPLMRESLAIFRKTLPANHSDTAATIDNLASLLQDQGKLAEAEQLYREGLAMRRKSLPPGHPDISFSLLNLATELWLEGKFEEAEASSREALDVRTKALPATHPLIGESLNNLGSILIAENRLEEGERYLRRALELRRNALPADHPDVSETIGNLATVLRMEGKLDESESMYRESLTMTRRNSPPGSASVGTSLNNLGTLLQDQGKFDEAATMLREALEVRRAALPPDHYLVAQSMANLALLLRIQGKLIEAEPLARDALVIDRKALPAGHPDTVKDLILLGTILERQGKLADAEPLYREALKFRTESLGRRERPTTQSAAMLSRLLDKLDRAEEAASLRTQYDLPQPASAPATREAASRPGA